MTVRFLDIAEAELDDAIRWYRTQAAGLGDACLLEVMAKVGIEEFISGCRAIYFNENCE